MVDGPDEPTQVKEPSPVRPPNKPTPGKAEGALPRERDGDGMGATQEKGSKGSRTARSL